jgi:hypothetical protein
MLNELLATRDALAQNFYIDEGGINPLFGSIY